ncbi:type II toxin-antitoxin system RelB/DinJ family antitoxin [Enterococcus sp. 669A]|uniref:Type II toxin-antitoxin system RelB/DinJ family antitoxin n=1 Tax=Candidatus Enterococcus moelleringii TaxID=2815325 RepID=A0ABS3LD22_9ENTE|nr:type II toxin-antitoxin system RelB/DinJ family antitoxin [Enterococcus sp. 669A]MBO1306990.1 type II toxin-antitoxin system RelB/DinJ family antitoxin [Enterococcus sp. 669A]
MKLVQARIDDELAEKAESILSDLGLTRSEALTLFYQQIILNNGLPFEVRLSQKPNEETVAALNEDLRDSKVYASSQELWEDLKT